MAILAAEMVADGWPYGTFDTPEWILAPGASVETAMMRAAYEVWGGPGWWRKNMTKANECLRHIRWMVCDNIQSAPFNMAEAEARARWNSLTPDETVVMLLFAAHWLRAAQPPRGVGAEGNTAEAQSAA